MIRASLSHLFPHPGLLACALSLLLVGSAGCSSSAGGAEEDAGGGEPSVWNVEQQGLPGAVLSIWSGAGEEMWACGADPGDGKGPMVLRRRDGVWSRLETGVTGHLWWVFGGASDGVRLVGVEGTVLRYDAATDSFVRATSPTDGVLFGVWGPAGGPLYAVGGHIEPKPGPGVVLQIDGDTVTDITGLLPKGSEPNEAYFKVWGTGPGDVWIIGDRGSVLHFDGSGWTRKEIADKPRLVTVHGAGSADVVIVGGIAQATIFERDQKGTWRDRAPAGLPALNGVFVRSEGGEAVAAGMLGTVLRREDGVWTELDLAPVRKDWHGVWMDARGDAYVVGGNLLSATTMNDGAILRYGPKRSEAGEDAGR